MEGKEFIKPPVLNVKDAIENGIVGKSGKVYKYCSELSANRYEFQEILAERMQFGYTPEMFSKKLTDMWGVLNKGHFGDTAIHLKNIIDARSQMTDRGKTALRIVALYFNLPGEDPSEVNESLMEDKVRDWTHYSYASFFALATSFVGLYSKNLSANLAKNLSELQTVAEAIEKEKSSPVKPSKKGRTK